MLVHKVQVYHALGLSRSRFMAMEIFSRAIPKHVKKMTC